MVSGSNRGKNVAQYQGFMGIAFQVHADPFAVFDQCGEHLRPDFHDGNPGSEWKVLEGFRFAEEILP
jgi:hypothetical protein